LASSEKKSSSADDLDLGRQIHSDPCFLARRPGEDLDFAEWCL
jgi:hypothetical protein